MNTEQALKALRDAGFVVICWTPADMPGATEDEKADNLNAAADALESRSIERGWEVIEALVGRHDLTAPHLATTAAFSEKRND